MACVVIDCKLYKKFCQSFVVGEFWKVLGLDLFLFGDAKRLFICKCLFGQEQFNKTERGLLLPDWCKPNIPGKVESLELQLKNLKEVLTPILGSQSVERVAFGKRLSDITNETAGIHTSLNAVLGNGGYTHLREQMNNK